MKKVFLLLIALAFGISVQGQTKFIDLHDYFSKGKLLTTKTTKLFAQDGKRGVSSTGIVWIKGMTFSTGTIEVDLRGQDLDGQSFIGIAFHGIDTITYDAVYFRPFNFRSTDSVRKIHAVQYINPPNFNWDVLRRDFNGVYEKGIVPPPDPNAWIHARIEVGDTEIKVFVNQAKVPSLVVKKLNDRKDGLIGTWSANRAVDGNYANLKITPSKNLP